MDSSSAALTTPPDDAAGLLTLIGEGEGPLLAGSDDRPEVLVSAIDQYSYCPRRCGLIHAEQSFQDNVFTIRGRLAHERVDSGEDTPMRGVPVARSMALWSFEHGLRGRADLVEFRHAGPYPVEYKLGKPRGDHAQLQLCAQALCLEEMLGLRVPRGAIYHIAIRRRVEVELDAGLRGRTLAIVAAVRELLLATRLPAPPNDDRCQHCSMREPCMPGVVGEPNRLRGLQGTLFQPWPLAASADDL
jgi:CRISPR-associated exonuclease Cas4